MLMGGLPVANATPLASANHVLGATPVAQILGSGCAATQQTSTASSVQLGHMQGSFHSQEGLPSTLQSRAINQRHVDANGAYRLPEDRHAYGPVGHARDASALNAAHEMFAMQGVLLDGARAGATPPPDLPFYRR